MGIVCKKPDDYEKIPHENATTEFGKEIEKAERDYLTKPADIKTIDEAFNHIFDMKFDFGKVIEAAPAVMSILIPGQK